MRHGSPWFSAVLLLVVGVGLVGCGSSGGGAAGPSTSATGGSGAGGGSGGSGGSGGFDETIGGKSFPLPEPWATPVEDYLAAGEAEVGSLKFLRGIHDLAVHDGKLFVGYGDANENLGRVIPIGLRSFGSPASSEADNEFDTDEEQVDHYRVIGDELWVAGIDATEDAWLGNVYIRDAGAQWTKSRTLEGGVHVHDVAGAFGAHFAVGSGATEQEWGKGDIYAHLWRSDDGGGSFAVAERIHNGGTGDARWVHLLPLSSQLLLFGYGSDAQFKIDELLNASYDGAKLTMLPGSHPLRWVFAVGTAPVTEGRAVVAGVDVSQDPLRNAAWLVQADGGAEVVAGLAGKTVIDVFSHHATGETLLLTFDGDDYVANQSLTEWQVRLLVTKDFQDFTELFTLTTELLPESIAYWQGAVYYGTGDGQVWRSQP